MAMVTMNHQTGSNLIELVVDGKVEQDDYKPIIEAAESITERHEKVRFLITVRDLGGVEPGALWEDLKYDAQHLKDVDKAAIVSDKAWYAKLAKVTEAFTDAEFKHFAPGERAAAEAWLS